MATLESFCEELFVIYKDIVNQTKISKATE